MSEVDDVGYYFNVLVDSEVEQELLCSLVTDLKSKGHNLKLSYELDCQEVEKSSDASIYIQEGVDITNCQESN